MMLFLIVFTMVTIGAVAYAVSSAVKQAWVEDDQQPEAPADVAAAGFPTSESLEGALVVQLAADEITRRQYIHAMERLAAREDARNPLAVPPEIDSAT